ncbi:hypothetical protein GCM10007989_26340 [Devosia pacifica]|uniref:Peptidoglycan binding-like domain-containing protein n=1 Tax=Devosia pacifica TaxID=1335967 RepID=A0A918SAF5_9HYPH|nr:peptidoglycan-binding domain-containing protein [Devosia pacifica]GHA29479.1 hypothetical protein GCM10007989_26340 [Devosia pacifica]
MTASTLTQLPVMASSAALTSVARVSGWALSRFMRAPVANTGMAAMATLTALAMSNALYNQTMPHPAPFFAQSPNVPTPVAPRTAEPQVIPPVEQAPVAPEMSAPAASTETTGSISSTEPVGNPDVFAVQKKLSELGHYSGSLDGLYGPNTARAIRAFEQAHGMTPEGALKPEVIQAILGASERQSSAEEPAEVPEPVQVAEALVEQPAPAPAVARAQVAANPARAETPAPAERSTASQTIDSIVAAFEADSVVRPSSVQTAEPVQRVAETPATQPMPPLTQTPEAAPAPVPEPVATAPTEEPTATAAIAQRQPDAGPAAANTELVTRIQRGLASLGFLHGTIDGVPGDSTARAIRNFEVYYNYRVTGEVRPELIQLLESAGASV